MKVDQEAQRVESEGQVEDSSDHDEHAASFSLTAEIIGVAVLLVALAGSGFAGHLRLQGRHAEQLQAAQEKFCVEACQQREQLVAAIECYRRALGCYPPDHVLSLEPLLVDVVTNQLLYELLGTCYDPVRGTFAVAGFPEIDRSLVRQFFGMATIKNATQHREHLRHFLDISNVAAVYPAKSSPCPVGLLAVWPNWEDMEPGAYRYFELTPWRYNSTSPEHNIGGFDLWVEISAPQTNIVIGNW